MKSETNDLWRETAESKKAVEDKLQHNNSQPARPLLQMDMSKLYTEQRGLEPLQSQKPSN